MSTSDVVIQAKCCWVIILDCVIMSRVHFHVHIHQSILIIIFISHSDTTCHDANKLTPVSDGDKGQ